MELQNHIKKIYSTMYRIRLFEEMVLIFFSKGLLNGTTHTSIGQEADAVGILLNLDKKKDFVFSNHRGHGHFIVFTGKTDKLLFEMMGLDEGACGGVGGSQHLYNRNFLSNGIQGGMVPIAVGNALGQKLRDTGGITVVFIGDGTLGEGIVYESFNMSSLLKVPILFVIENNYYAQSTPSYLQIAGKIIDRPKAFGIDTIELTTTDVSKIYSVSKELIHSIRKNKVPKCLIINTYRFAPHSKGDDYRDKEEIERHKENDPLKIFKKKYYNINFESLEKKVEGEIKHLKKIALDLMETDNDKNS